MAFPLKVHRITIRYQDSETASELILDPAAIMTMIVHSQELEPPGVPRGTHPVLVDPTDRAIGCIPGVVRTRPAGHARRARRGSIPGVCWHEPTCTWYCMDVHTAGLLITEVEFVYANRDGTWRTVLDARKPDLIVYRNHAEPDPAFRQVTPRTVKVIAARDLDEKVFGVLSHRKVQKAASVAADIGWHNPDCTWYEPE